MATALARAALGVHRLLQGQELRQLREHSIEQSSLARAERSRRREEERRQQQLNGLRLRFQRLDEDHYRFQRSLDADERVLVAEIRRTLLTAFEQDHQAYWRSEGQRRENDNTIPRQCL